MSMTRVDLRREAAAEVARLTAARRIAFDGDQQAMNRLEADAPWINVSRHTTLRRALGGHICLIWRAAFDDESGRFVASRLVAVLVDVRRAGNRRSRSWLTQFLAASDASIRVHVHAACVGWRADVVRMVNASTAARLEREETIDRGAPRPGADAQPGLFDRRAVRSREAHDAAVAASKQARALRLRAIHTAAHLVPSRLRLLLVLVS
jgi:hypothetical protein